jgi:PIN domain nuclease of toxin-antitoxin system
VSLVLLDTHVWVWGVEGDLRRIGRRTRGILSRARTDDAIRVSPATVFEVTAQHTAGRLRLSRSPEQWIQDALAVNGVRLAALSAEVALDAGSIPRTALPDPLDRLIVATARQLDARLLTADTRILEYASQTANVRVHDARL